MNEATQLKIVVTTEWHNPNFTQSSEKSVKEFSLVCGGEAERYYLKEKEAAIKSRGIAHVGIEIIHKT